MTVGQTSVRPVGLTRDPDELFQAPELPLFRPSPSVRAGTVPPRGEDSEL